MDCNYCLISITQKLNISLYLFFSKDNYPICITARRSNDIYHLMSLHKSFDFLSIEHCLYLGRELYKAELALVFNQEYVQN
uniref:conserved hypothetical plastid protein n=1 Tax=Hypnea cervicornis TaxID=387623 RepID=UPI0021B66C70|nr:conserved hypothetical plastid protein [Hypnea cervicornis]UVW80766.1 conserved hypothetical plastid protein [Hypnea cervicornis]